MCQLFSMAIMVAVEIAVAPVAVPLVIVGPAAVIAFPVAFDEALAIVARDHPDGAGVRWSSPVTVMPFVTVSNRIPVAVHPDESRAGSSGPDPNHPWRRRRADPNADRNLGEGGASGNERQGKQCLLDAFSDKHIVCQNTSPKESAESAGGPIRSAILLPARSHILCRLGMLCSSAHWFICQWRLGSRA